MARGVQFRYAKYGQGLTTIAQALHGIHTYMKLLFLKEFHIFVEFAEF